MTAYDLYDEGWKLNQIDSLEGAVQKYRAAIVWSFDRSIETWQVRRELTRALMRQRKYEEAEEEVLRLFSDNPPASGLDGLSAIHADILYELGKHEEAAEKYRFSLQHSEQKAINYLYGDGSYDYEFSIEQQEFVSAALRCFHMVGDDSSVRHLIEFLCSHQSVVGRDGKKLAFTLDDDESMEEELARVLLEIAEPHTALYYEFAGLPGQMPFDSCTSCLQHSIKLKPQAKAFAMLGRHFQMGGQPAEAVAVFSEMNSLFPADFDEDSARSFGWALQALDSLVEAEHWLRKSALDFYPDDLNEVEPLITFYAQCQRWADATEVIENYLSAQMFKSKLALTDAHLAWSLHARCCELLGDLETADSSRSQANMYREHLLRERIANGEFSWLNHYQLGFLLKSQGRSDEAEYSLLIAEQEFVAATQEGENNWWGHYWLGLLHEERGSLIEADAHFREAFRVDPVGSQSPELDIGRVLLKRGFIEESERHLRAAFDKQPWSQQKYWLGKCLLESGQVAEAEKLLAEVAHDEPFDAEYAAALEACRLASEMVKPPT